jgi:5-methylcytosine-specific restriction endonuclease McrBC regulatory subunit McrC
MAQAYFGLNNLRKTIHFASQSLQENPDDLTKERLYFLLSYSYYLRKDDGNGILYYKKVRNLNPESAYTGELRMRWGEFI